MKIFNDQKQFHKTLQLFDKYKNDTSAQLPIMIILQTLKACSQTRDLQRGEDLHRLVPSHLRDNPYIVTSLIHLYMQCGKMKTAESLLDECRTKDVPMYNAMMKGYITHKMFQRAIDMFHRVKNPTEVTTIVLFNACAHLQNKDALAVVKDVLSRLPKSFLDNPRLSTSLIDALMKCGDIREAESVFGRLTVKSQAMYGAMIQGYAKHGMFDKVIDMFHQVPQPDEMNVGFVFNACAQLGTKEALALVKTISSTMPRSFYSNALTLASYVDALMKCGETSAVESAFRHRTSDDLVWYAALISGYAHNQMPREAISLFEEMSRKRLVLKGTARRTDANSADPTHIIYLSVIDALAEYADLTTAESIVKRIPTSLLEQTHIRNALIHMWGKVGCVDKAEVLFSSMQQPDYIGYTAMINAYGLNGLGRQAVQLFDRMPREYRDGKTHVCVLNACSHSGLIDEARRIFRQIPHAESQAYATMVDCLSRGGLFDEARQLIDRFESASAPSLSMYMALLSGCRKEKQTNLGEEVYNRMIRHFPEARESLTAAAVLFANTAASSGDMSKASSVRTQLTAKKTTGLSWTTVNGQFYRFRAHDQSHPRSAEIHAEVARMMDEAVQRGHTYDASWVTRPLKPGETAASVLCGHSEKLAIAWNFLENPRTTRIQIAKNLRVCGDCHAATKLIALARQCDIIVRDANRMHHFSKDGTCSCNDYF